MSSIAMIDTRVRILFDQLLASATEVEFKPEYVNGTGYFDPLVRVKFNQKLSRMADNHGRPILIVAGDNDTSVVVFQRYSNRPDVLCTNHNLKDLNHLAGELSDKDNRVEISNVVNYLNEVVRSVYH